MSIAARRLAALPDNPEADDLAFACSLDWRLRDKNPAAAQRLLKQAGESLRAGERLPAPLAEWLADALKIATAESTPRQCAEMLRRKLGLPSEDGRPRKRVDPYHARLLSRLGMSQRQIAQRLGVSAPTVGRLLEQVHAETRPLSSEDVEKLLQSGASILRKARKP